MKKILIIGIIVSMFALTAYAWNLMTPKEIETPDELSPQAEDVVTEEAADETPLQAEEVAEKTTPPPAQVQVETVTQKEQEVAPESTSNTPPIKTNTAKSFTVSGINYKFNVSEIRVKEGDTVTINFESTGGFHDWVIDEFAAATEKVQPGQTTSVTFVADKAGTYEYYCSVGSHRASGMVGTLIVE